MQTNVDPLEIEKFSNLASRWWDLNGEFKPLHQINPLRTDFINEQCQGLFGKQIVDVGCGGGILSESMATHGGEVTGIDMGHEPLEVARLHGLESGVNVNYIQTTAEQLASEKPQSYDVVTCLEMLEHVPNPESVIHACAQLVKPNGMVFFSTLNRNIKSYLMAIVAAEKVLKLVPDGTHEHDKFIRPSELLSWVDNTALKPVTMTGLHFNPLLNEYYLSNKNVDVNYIVSCQHQGD
jgi:2-polyprenyl-6-hydroxyphenyl methylase/3-demethylubiquinone-9 3-methyltransferase